MSVQTQINRINGQVSEQTDLIAQLKGAITENVSKTSNEVSEQATLIAEIKTALEGKAGSGSGGEDVTAETAAYTEKLVELETAIIALEIELEGKATGGGVSVETYTGTIFVDDGPNSEVTMVYYTDDTFTLRSELVPVIGYLLPGEPLSITVAANTVVFVATNRNVSIQGNDIRFLNYDYHSTNGSGICPIANGFVINLV